MMKNVPKVSVCIPVYNAGEYLKPAIASVLAQDYADFELLVVDDYSLECTELILESFSDQRLRFERNTTNLGLPANWNKSIELASGEYVTIFHQDDLMISGNLRRKVNLLDSHPEMGFVYSDIVTIDKSGEITGGHYIPQPESDLVMPGCRVFEMVAATGNPIACPSVIVRASCYEQLGAFDTRYPFATDLEMWLRIAGHYSVGYISKPLIAHRIHNSQEGARFRGTGQDYLDNYRVLRTVFARELSPDCATHARKSFKTLAIQSAAMARWKLRQGQLKKAWRYTLVALKSLLSSLLLQP
ncbi:MAG: glycosyltransferase [Anaerolineae bacterium]|nr:glycosyltransferase [Anaerolineae bacterium]